MLRISDLAIIE